MTKGARIKKFKGWKTVDNKKYREYSDKDGDLFLVVGSRRIYKPSTYLKKKRKRK